MRTRKQIEASRRNGARSRGPTTAEGKARSALNATRHGLSSRVVVLANESSDTFDGLLQACIEHWRPATAAELILVHDIAGARWRIHRALAMESATLDHEMDRQRANVDSLYSQIDEPTRCALAFNALVDNGRAITTYGRYETRLRRIIDRAAAELRRLWSERAAESPPAQTPFLQNEPGGEQPARNQPVTE
jgi:hypothetical protein